MQRQATLASSVVGAVCHASADQSRDCDRELSCAQLSSMRRAIHSAWSIHFMWVGQDMHSIKDLARNWEDIKTQAVNLLFHVGTGSY